MEDIWRQEGSPWAVCLGVTVSGLLTFYSLALWRRPIGSALTVLDMRVVNRIEWLLSAKQCGGTKDAG